MKKIIVASLTLAFASAAQSAVLLEKIVERTSDGMALGHLDEPERNVKKTCSIQDDGKMVIQYQTGDLISKVSYPIQVDKILIAKKIAAVVSEVQINGDKPNNYGYVAGELVYVGSISASYNSYNKKTKVPLLNYKPSSMAIAFAGNYKANSETATNLKTFIDITCDNLPTVTESDGVR